MYKFLNETHTDCEICHFLMAKNLIKDAMQCSHCHQEMDLKPSKESPERFNWRCLNAKCIHYQSTMTLRSGSFFQTFQAPMLEVLKTIYLYSK